MVNLKAEKKSTSAEKRKYNHICLSQAVHKKQFMKYLRPFIQLEKVIHYMKFMMKICQHLLFMSVLSAKSVLQSCVGMHSQL